jgi:glycosyltransferase involved in cell wall biosynthesis
VSRPAVAVVTTYYRPVLGGAEAAAERLAGFLSRRGHRVVVLTKRTSRKDPESETIDGVDVVRLPPTGARSGRGKWAAIPAVTRALVQRRKSIDAICVVDYRGVGLAALAARPILRTPVIFQAQTEGVLSANRVRGWLGRAGASTTGGLASLATWPVRALYRRADAIACISRALMAEAVAAGVPADRVHYLPNPVDTRRFSPASPDERVALRARLGVGADEVVAVFVGRLSREKGIIELLHAWADAKPAARLVVIGPPMTDHPWDVSGEARAIIDAHQLASRVMLTGGQPADVVAGWLRVADFAVQPSHFEAMGLAAAEEMAAGLPVIATETTGYRDFVIHEETGLVVPVGDPRALSQAISRLTADAGLRRRLGAQARERAATFDEDVVLERFAQLIDRLASRG